MNAGQFFIKEMKDHHSLATPKR